MAPPSDRELRVIKRTFMKVKEEIEEMLSSKITVETMGQIEVLFDGNLKVYSEKYEQAANEFFLLVDETSKEDLDLEKRIVNDQTEVRQVFSLLQAKVKNAAAALKGDELRKSIVPALNSTIMEPKQCSEQPKLKKIEIPEFDGDLSKFYNFKALFSNLVHTNPDFSNVQKLYYLKQALVGKASIVLQDCELADDAYLQAWSYVLDRYENKRAITRTFFVKLSELKPIKSEAGIRDLLDQTMAIIRGLKVAGESVDDTFSRYIAFIVCSKLDPATAKDWDIHTCEKSKYPKFEDLFKFLQGRSFIIDEKRIEKPKEGAVVRNEKVASSSGPKKSFLASVPQSSKSKCPMCTGQHYLNQCAAFKAMTAHRRYDFVKSMQMCLVCFGKEHAAINCSSKFRCKCGKPHHSLLHFEFKGSSNDADGKKDQNAEESESNQSTKKSYNGAVQRSVESEKVVLLPSAIVRFSAGNANGTIRILLDSCAQATMISDRLVKRYRLPTESAAVGTMLGGITPGFVSCDKIVRLSLISRTECFEIEIEAEVVPPASMNYQIQTQFSKESLEKLAKFQLADPALVKKPVRISDVDLILGAEYFGKCISERTERIGELFLMLSKFGWTVSGPVKEIGEQQKKFSGLTLRSIEDHLKAYNAVESAVSLKKESKEEIQQFLKHFHETRKIAPDGKFDLDLPLKENRKKVKNNRRLALFSLYRMEKKLDPVLKKKYVEFMREYFAMNHGSLVPPSPNGYFIPHRCVVREESLTTPVRVVFNASSHEKGELSLNDVMMMGPQIQRELFDIIISVRFYQFVITADIEKMYRMIWINEKDREMQKILWRESPDQPILEYQLNTVTYGTTAASFMATLCLEVIAQELQDEHPVAAQLIRENFYMDDFIAGGNEIEEVKKTRQVIHSALLKHGFKLRKYSANVPELLSDVPSDLIVNGSNVELASNVGMLGVVWSPPNDAFCVKINVELDSLSPMVTKRLIMSLLARTFDPLGVVAPFSIRGKLMIQSLWKQGLDWDQEVSEETKLEFIQYLQELSELEHLKIDRYISHPGTKTQLVGFCDASVRAYCAVLFARSIGSDGVLNCRLICAKTRVAPQKQMTVPKMELSSALLLSQLVDRVRKNLNIELEDCFLFTDATIVLCWLSQPPSSWKTFVSNRVEKINLVIPYEHWFYVHTTQNPADLATRGLSVAEFLDSSLWFEGPAFLSNVLISSSPIPNLDLSQALEKRKVQVFKVCKVELPDLFIDKYSSFSFMLRVLAFVLRFTSRPRINKKSVVLSAAELDNALVFALRLVQRFFFFEDIERLSSKKALKADSRLLPLTPFLDDRFLLRVGGRLERSSLSSSRKHPIILPAKASFTEVLIRWVHERYFHANRRFLMGYLSSRYWIVGGCARLVKRVIFGCVRCTRFKGEAASQLMGQLPPFRVEASRPFTHTGVDLAGPFTCKCVMHRTTRYYKVYVAIFVCMVVKCVHMEIVSDLSSAKFVEALQRFIARRGCPSNLYSDNGTNFVGAKNLIIDNQERVLSFLASEGISWSMIPPRSPHFGGLWESAVRSAKYHFSRVNVGNVLSYDEYVTMVARVEAILNSRPLCVDVSQGSEVLTPGHFLIGCPLTAPPALENLDGAKSLSTRLWELNNRVRSFWISWKADYLNQLQRRYKWQHENPNLAVGQIVLLKDESGPCDWPLAEIVRVYPDASGVVRVVDVRVAKSSTVFKRAIHKIILLPIDVNIEPPKGSMGGVCSSK